MKAIKRWIQSATHFFGEVKGEALKISYPTRSEVIRSTSAVLLLALIVSLFLAVTDAVLVRLLRWII